MMAYYGPWQVTTAVAFGPRQSLRWSTVVLLCGGGLHFGVITACNVTLLWRLFEPWKSLCLFVSSYVFWLGSTLNYFYALFRETPLKLAPKQACLLALMVIVPAAGSIFAGSELLQIFFKLQNPLLRVVLRSLVIPTLNNVSVHMQLRAVQTIPGVEEPATRALFLLPVFVGWAVAGESMQAAASSIPEAVLMAFIAGVREARGNLSRLSGRTAVDGWASRLRSARRWLSAARVAPAWISAPGDEMPRPDAELKDRAETLTAHIMYSSVADAAVTNVINVRNLILPINMALGATAAQPRGETTTLWAIALVFQFVLSEIVVVAVGQASPKIHQTARFTFSSLVYVSEPQFYLSEPFLDF